jgi:hypothetical protein
MWHYLTIVTDNCLTLIDVTFNIPVMWLLCVKMIMSWLLLLWLLLKRIICIVKLIHWCWLCDIQWWCYWYSEWWLFGVTEVFGDDVTNVDDCCGIVLAIVFIPLLLYSVGCYRLKWYSFGSILFIQYLFWHVVWLYWCYSMCCIDIIYSLMLFDICVAKRYSVVYVIVDYSCYCRLR